MPLVQESFHMGLVTKRHPTLLRPGELQQADDCVFRLFDTAIHRVGGRTAFNANSLGATPIKGLAHLAFDAGSDVLLAYHTTKFHTAPWTDLADEFTAMLDDVPALPDVGTETMVPVPFANRYHLLIPDAYPRRVGYINPAGGDVADCTLSGGTTLTTTATKGFKNVIVGQGISGSGGGGAIAANTRVQSKTSDTVIVLNTTGTNGGPFTSTLATTPFLQQQVAGLLPTSEPLTVAQTADAGDAWSAVLGTGYYWFIYTEMVIPGAIDDDATGFLESGFIGDMQAGSITNTTTQAINITRPSAVVNTVANDTNAATHWQVYMSDVRRDNLDKPSLATFTRIGEPIVIATTSFKFKDTQVIQGFNPTANEAITGMTGWVNPAGAHNPYDGSKASVPSLQRVGTAYTTFGFTDNGLTVVGIEVTIWPSCSGSVILRSLTNNKLSAAKYYSAAHMKKLGGKMDTWGESWVAADFRTAPNNFKLELRGHVEYGSQVDGLVVRVFYSGTSVNRNGRSFRTVTYRDQVGTTVSDTTAFSVYRPTTGDVFLGSMVINDPADPAAIRYSLPGSSTSFPKPYFLHFQLPNRKDRVTYIRRVGQVLVVGMRDHIQRVNYLPTELDTDFQQGLTHEDLVTDHGIPGPHAATLVDMGDGPVLAYVSLNGLHITDGIRTRFLNIDLDWENTVDLSKLDKCILRVYTKENWLVLFYVPSGATHSTPTRALVFSYAPDKIKEGGLLPAIGPFKVAARSAADAVLNGQAYLLTGHNSLGRVYVEDQGLTIPGTYTVLNAAGAETAPVIVPTIKTRRIYPSGLGRQSREQRVYIMSDAHGSTVTAASDTTIDNATITSASLFGSVRVGMLVTGSGIQADTVVLTASASTITVSRVALATAVGVTLTFDNGVYSVTVRGQDIGFAVASLETVYDTTRIGGLTVLHPDNMKESFELLVAKVNLPDGTAAGLDVGMRLHYFAYLQTDAGQETNTAP